MLKIYMCLQWLKVVKKIRIKNITSSHFWELFIYESKDSKKVIEKEKTADWQFLWEIFKRKLFKKLKIREWKTNSILYYFILRNQNL